MMKLIILLFFAISPLSYSQTIENKLEDDLLTTSLICGKNLDSNTKKICQQSISIVNTNQAFIYTQKLSLKMLNLANEYELNDNSSKTCDLYLDLNNYLKQAKVNKTFNESTRLSYRIKWYLNPEVDFSVFCLSSEVEFSAPVHLYLQEHSYSLKFMTFN
jgi:hypothetical protein